MPAYVQLGPGEPAPWFRQRSFANPRYVFDTAAGRYLVLCFLGSAADPHAKAVIASVQARTDLFDDLHASFFGVTNDPEDETAGRVSDRYPGHRYIFDFDGTVSRLYGAVAQDAEFGAQGKSIRRMWVVLDPTLRVLRVVPFAEGGAEIAAVLAWLASLPPPVRFAGTELQAPILVLPNVFEPAFCQSLIGLYEDNGGEESGFMREIDGRTVAIQDHAFKRRRDYTIEDQALIGQLQARILRRVVPEIEKVHQFKATRMERYLVACYAAEDQAHFRAHRDNTTKGTAHRRFAVSVNLNDDFDGGEVSFPEYGPRSFKAPPGGAVVFSCSLLHAVSQITRGRRFAFLPFLYDDAAARIREANIGFLADGKATYKSGLEL